jgi:hypothetical protein
MSGRRDVPKKVQNDQLNLGELRSTHRPSTIRLWIMAIIALALLMAVLLGVLLTFDSLSTQSREGTFARAASPLACLGASSLCLAILGSFLISDFRKWSATGTVRLQIYQDGLSYESKGQFETYRWDEIKDINFKVIEIRSKHSIPRKARVIRSIVSRNGSTINLAETLNLIEITELVTKAKKEHPN